MSSITVHAPKITILDQAINMIDGLYSLNDMHRASGSDKKYQPSNFMRNKETKELVEELQAEYSSSSDMRNLEPVRALRGVQKDNTPQGTYVCKDLVYRYAMWISPKFALLVIRTFDKLVTGELKVKPTGLSTTEDRKPLVNAVNIFCNRTGSFYADVWKMVHQKFNVDGVEQLTVEQVPEAVTYIHWLTMTANTRNHTNQINAENAHALAIHMNNCADWFDAVREPLSQLNPQLTSSISGQFYEGRSTARLVRRELISA